MRKKQLLCVRASLFHVPFADRYVRTQYFVSSLRFFVVLCLRGFVGTQPVAVFYIEFFHMFVFRLFVCSSHCWLRANDESPTIHNNDNFSLIKILSDSDRYRLTVWLMMHLRLSTSHTRTRLSSIRHQSIAFYRMPSAVEHSFPFLLCADSRDRFRHDVAVFPDSVCLCLHGNRRGNMEWVFIYLVFHV